MYEYTWYQWLSFFYIYCFFGWIFESTYVSLKQHRFVNRGFLRLPMLPLYGTGAVMMLWVSLPFKSSLVMVYIRCNRCYDPGICDGLGNGAAV